jgi:hypothetical protein
MTRLAACVALIVACSGCTYGPVQETARAWTAEERLNAHQFAVVVSWQRFRDPTGLSRFSDGGSRRILEEAALFYVCDVDSVSARPLARVERPQGMESGFESSILGWDGNVFYAVLTGRRYSWRRGAVGPMNRRYYRIGSYGTSTEVDHAPESLHREPESGVLLPGETRFLRVSTGPDGIDVRLNERGSYVRMFRVNHDGTIVPVGNM